MVQYRKNEQAHSRIREIKRGGVGSNAKMGVAGIAKPVPSRVQTRSMTRKLKLEENDEEEDYEEEVYEEEDDEEEDDEVEDDEEEDDEEEDNEEEDNEEENETDRQPPDLSS